MKNFKLILVVVLVMIMLTGCLPGNRTSDDEPVGFLWGVLHGALAPVTLILSIFKPDVNMYEVINNGFWYNLGFYLTVIGSTGGITVTWHKKKA